MAWTRTVVLASLVVLGAFSVASATESSELSAAKVEELSHAEVAKEVQGQAAVGAKADVSQDGDQGKKEEEPAEKGVKGEKKVTPQAKEEEQEKGDKKKQKSQAQEQEKPPSKEKEPAEKGDKEEQSDDDDDDEAEVEKQVEKVAQGEKTDKVVKEDGDDDDDNISSPPPKQQDTPKKPAPPEEATSRADMQGTYEEVPKELRKYMESGKAPAKCNVYAKNVLSMKAIPSLRGELMARTDSKAPSAVDYLACAYMPTGLNIYHTLKFNKRGMLPEKILYYWFRSGADGSAQFDFHSVLAHDSVNGCARLGGPFKMFGSKEVLLRGPMFCVTMPMPELAPNPAELGDSDSLTPLALIDTTERDKKIKFGKVSIEIIGQMEINISGQQFVFTLWLKLFPTLIALRAGLQGAICNLFVKGWCFDQIMIEAGVTGPQPTFFAAGGKLGIGSGCEKVFKKQKGADPSKCTRGSLYFGLDTLDPTNSYVSANLPSFTIGTMLEFLAPWMPLDGFETALNSIGFPDGVYMSHAGDRHDFMWGSIPKGTFFQGTVMIFGYKGKFLARYSGAKVFCQAKLEPIDLGGILKISRSIVDDVNGPIFSVKALNLLAGVTDNKERLMRVVQQTAEHGSHSLIPKIHIEGATGTMGIKRHVKLEVTNTGISWFAEGAMFGSLLQAQYHFQLLLPKDVQQGRLNFVGKLLTQSKIKVHGIFSIGKIYALFKKAPQMAADAAKKIVAKMKKAHALMKKLGRKIGIETKSLEEEQELLYAREEAKMDKKTFSSLGEALEAYDEDGLTKTSRHLRDAKLPRGISESKELGEDDAVQVGWRRRKNFFKKALNKVKRGITAPFRAAYNAAKKVFEKIAMAAKGLADFIKNLVVHGPGYVFEVCGGEFELELSLVSPMIKVASNLMIYGRRTQIALNFWLLDPVKTLMENFKALKHLFFTAARAFTGRGKEICKKWIRNKVATGIADKNAATHGARPGEELSNYELGENLEEISFDSGNPFQRTFPVPPESKTEMVPNLDIMTEELPDPKSLKKKADYLNPKPKAKGWRTDGKPEDVRGLNREAKKALKEKEAQNDREEEEEDRAERKKQLDGGSHSTSSSSDTQAMIVKAVKAAMKAGGVKSGGEHSSRSKVMEYMEKVDRHSKAVQTHLNQGKALFEEMKHRVDKAIKSNQCSALKQMESGIESVLGEYNSEERSITTVAQMKRTIKSMLTQQRKSEAALDTALKN